MRERTYGIVVLLAMIIVFALSLSARAWHPIVQGDCEGWTFHNPEASWNSGQLPMHVDILGVESFDVAYGETDRFYDDPGYNQLETIHYRVHWVGPRGEVDPQGGTNTRSLEGCDPTTTTTAPPTTSTTQPETTTTTEPPTTTTTQPPTSSTTPETSSTTTSTLPPTTSTSTPPTTGPPTTPPDELPETGPDSVAPLAILGTALLGLGLAAVRSFRDREEVA